jgi:hypothetical protein
MKNPLAREPFRVDVDSLEREIHNTPLPSTPRLEDYVPPHQTPIPTLPPAVKPQRSPLQVIAYGLTKLTWREAEVMGDAVKALMKEDTSLTAAIIAWAEKWETFE